MKKIIFRTDASAEIGSGHVMRCLTLAGLLAENGVECEFICREHVGNLIDYIAVKGFRVSSLKCSSMALNGESNYSSWLGESQENDAYQCIEVLENYSVSWLVVDHYGIDQNWEKLLKGYCDKLLSIDDLADKVHHCDALLDQTYGRPANDYVNLVPNECDIFTGCGYALLKSEFVLFRSASLSRRSTGFVRNIMINLGGVDKNNYTLFILNILGKIDNLDNIVFSVILGPTAPNIESVRFACLNHRYDVRFLEAVENMAELMSTCDLSISAAGATTWERCCLGLPTILLTLADNQKYIADILSKNNIVLNISSTDSLESTLPIYIQKCLHNKEILANLTRSSIGLVDGKGAEKIARYLLEN